MPKAKYSPLSSNSTTTRVLAILPSMRKSSPIRAKLLEVNIDELDNAPFAFYEALSYTWGDIEQQRASCKLNGHEHLITQNLDAALRRLRGRTRKRWLWVDALCINQEDAEERARQVQRMRRIYESAEQTLVWLGSEADNSGLAIETLEYFTDADCDEDIGESLADESQRERWLAVAKLLDREWFRRVWVRQEIAVAKGAHLLCGRDHLRWDTLVLAHHFLTSPELVSEFDRLVRSVSNRGSGMHWVATMEMFREDYTSQGEVPLRELLLHAKGNDVSDDRDRVFGMLGLADARDEVEVDYTISAAQVFTRAMIALFEHSQKLDGLDGCFLSMRETEGLPSWVIDLSADFGAMVLRSREGWESLYSAAGNEPARFSVGESGLLRAKGVSIDTIESVAGSIYCNADRFPTVPGHHIGYWLQLAREFLHRQDSTMSEYAVMEVFCRILVADSTDVGERATPDFWQHVLDGETFDTLPNKLKEIFESEEPYFSTRMAQVLDHRVMIATSSGLIGLGDMACKEGDIVCILLGAGVPFVLRVEHEHHLLVGEAYIHGMMDGQAIEKMHSQGEQAIEFCIR